MAKNNRHFNVTTVDITGSPRTWQEYTDDLADVEKNLTRFAAESAAAFNLPDWRRAWHKPLFVAFVYDTALEARFDYTVSFDGTVTRT